MSTGITELVSMQIIEAVLKASFEAMSNMERDANPTGKAFIQGYLTAINDFHGNLSAFLDSDHSNPEIELRISVTSPLTTEGGER